MSRVRTALFVAMAVAGLACSRGGERTPAPAKPLNVIVIVVDTLRADHVGTLGYDRSTTPFIDRFASDSLVFERARSQAACTFPSVNSLLTSRYPGVFIRQPEGQMGIPPETMSISEILQQRGYSTIAVSASHIVRATPTEYNPGGGFGRGFDTFVEGCRWRHGTCLSKKASAELDQIEEPFFLYLHYMEPHSPYQPPKNWKYRFAGDYDGYDFIREGDPNPIAKMLFDDGPELDISDRDLAHLVDLYDEEIRFFDGVFRRLIGRLEAQGLLDRSLLVLTSDHGEEFLEHGLITHCRGIWDTVTRVPLILRIPGVEGGRRISAAAANIDIVPTIVDYLGIVGEDFEFQGSTLRPLIEGRDTGPRYAFADQGRYRSVDDGRYHLILDAANGSVSLFDVRTDPLEQIDLYTDDHPEASRLGTALNQWLENIGQRFRLDRALADAKTKEDELRALGYIE
jgi:arylsulfatase A-like enzyme